MEGAMEIATLESDEALARRLQAEERRPERRPSIRVTEHVSRSGRATKRAIVQDSSEDEEGQPRSALVRKRDRDEDFAAGSASDLSLPSSDDMPSNDDDSPGPARRKAKNSKGAVKAKAAKPAARHKSAGSVAAVAPLAPAPKAQRASAPAAAVTTACPTGTAPAAKRSEGLKSSGTAAAEAATTAAATAAAAAAAAAALCFLQNNAAAFNMDPHACADAIMAPPETTTADHHTSLQQSSSPALGAGVAPPTPGAQQQPASTSPTSMQPDDAPMQHGGGPMQPLSEISPGQEEEVADQTGTAARKKASGKGAAASGKAAKSGNAPAGASSGGAAKSGKAAAGAINRPSGAGQAAGSVQGSDSAVHGAGGGSLQQGAGASNISGSGGSDGGLVDHPVVSMMPARQGAIKSGGVSKAGGPTSLPRPALHTTTNNTALPPAAPLPTFKAAPIKAAGGQATTRPAQFVAPRVSGGKASGGAASGGPSSGPGPAGGMFAASARMGQAFKKKGFVPPRRI